MRRTIAITTVTAAVVLVVLFTTTTPSTSGPLGILGFFVALYITALGVLTFLFDSLRSVVAKLPAFRNKNFSMGELSFKRAYYYASVLALVPIILIAMYSVSDIGIYQVFLVCFFVVIAWVYIKKRTI